MLCGVRLNILMCLHMTNLSKKTCVGKLSGEGGGGGWGQDMPL